MTKLKTLFSEVATFLKILLVNTCANSAISECSCSTLWQLNKRFGNNYVRRKAKKSNAIKNLQWMIRWS